ncbi:protein kinase family protein [Parashewanella spongiae]|uniref:Protein kinase family protein n=1 Tax=Parashewanella spongiae TaxID=342950 RepID=A0A3A6TY96_9GAMM|nr:protein kinase [Parashewanella spongiae]MCL1079901.1 protein kinase [Parashewanella spongiae]RJY06455.1 protein kinase family protein [Parashewanella spongiae]
MAIQRLSPNSLAVQPQTAKEVFCNHGFIDFKIKAVKESIDVNRFHIIRWGMFSTVYEGKCKRCDFKLAVKVRQLDGYINNEEELKVLIYVGERPNDNIITFFGIVRTSVEFQFIFEKADLDLTTLLSKSNSPLTIGKINNLVRQILNVYEYLDTHKIQAKPDNPKNYVYVKSSDKLKLIDFELCIFGADGNKSLNTLNGFGWYLAELSLELLGENEAIEPQELHKCCVAFQEAFLNPNRANGINPVISADAFSGWSSEFSSTLKKLVSKMGTQDLNEAREIVESRKEIIEIEKLYT